MRVHIVAIGRARPGPLRDLVTEYAGRLVAFPLEVREVEPKRRADGPDLRRLEGAALLGAIPPKALVVALDERGAVLSSQAFADRVGAWRDSGVADLAFLIGGADGLDDEVRRAADVLLSLGAMTWPHLLVRVLLAEQLYRAQSILAGHPYHRA